MIDKLDRFHKTKPGYLLFGLIELALAYAMASLAIDRGTWWWYVLTLVFLVGALQNFCGLLRRKGKRR